METRKVQRLGPSTLAMTLPAEWAKEHNVNKGDEVSLRMGGKGTLTVLPESASQEDALATIRADALDAAPRTGNRRPVRTRSASHPHRKSEGALDSEHINAVYKAETQLMGLGVIEETPERIAIRCSVDPEDFTLDNLLERLRIHRVDDAQRGGEIPRPRQPRPRSAGVQPRATGQRDIRPAATAHLHGLPEPQPDAGYRPQRRLPAIGYRSIARSLELTADNAEDIAEIALETEDHSLNVDSSTMRRIREFPTRSTTSPSWRCRRLSTELRHRDSGPRTDKDSATRNTKSSTTCRRWTTRRYWKCVKCLSASSRPPSCDPERRDRDEPRAQRGVRARDYRVIVPLRSSVRGVIFFGRGGGQSAVSLPRIR